MTCFILLVKAATITASQCQSLFPDPPAVTEEYIDEYGLHDPTEDYIEDGYGDVAAETLKGDHKIREPLPYGNVNSVSQAH